MRFIARLALSSLAASTVLVAFQPDASAQLLAGTDYRCEGATVITPTMATARYQWALFCRNNLPPAPVGTTYSAEQWLTTPSVTDYNAPVNAPFQNRMYPVYFNFLNGQIWNAPDSATALCSLRPNPATNAGVCVSGCYVEGTALQFTDGQLAIKSALDRGKADLVTLAPTATLDNLQYIDNKVERYTSDLAPDWQVIYSLTMASGGTLQVTAEHPLITSDGVIRQAKSLHVGDALVLASGKPDPIQSVVARKEFTKVYNVKPVTVDYASNIVVAGGYLNGSVRYQNQFLDMINAVILRRAFTEQVASFE